MAESYLEERLNKASTMTGDIYEQRQLYHHMKKSLERADRIDIIVSFLMESGVRLLLDDLKRALSRKVKIRLLTGNYLGITQPSALYLVKYELGEDVDLRFYNEKTRSFHPKAYFFHYHDYSEIYIGSSNISKSALTSGIEWNYRFTSESDRKSYDEFFSVFNDLFLNHSILIDDERLREYSKSYHRPSCMKDLEEYDEVGNQEESKHIDFFRPRGAQIEALCALASTRDEGASKALVVAATGVGKTAIAAFDSIGYESILFVSHREEILKQSARTFSSIRKTNDYGFFDGKRKCNDKPLIFASVSTLANNRYLDDEYFKRDQFKYLVIDEIHHGVTSQYRKVIDYFKPNFMLGLTATPERMDGRSIYEVCDYNVPYELTLKSAINQGMLVPFHYYGIYDDTVDYTDIHLVRGHYDENELNERFLGNERRYNLIFNYYRKYGSDRALGFCSSRLHAEAMAKAFSERGIPSVAVYSNGEGEYSRERSIAIKDLEEGKVKVIFSVDMFNEGVDIPSVDMVMFLRPTESPVVFLQQLGRGLRKDRDKYYLTVLDFIGNYERCGNVRRYLFGDDTKARSNPKKGNNLPDDCIVDFDMRLIDLFERMDNRNRKTREIILDEYHRIEDLLSIRPMRMDLFTSMQEDVYQLAIEHSKENPFKCYLEYLHSLNALDDDEKKLYEGIGREFITLLENTNMTKVYKMPVLISFYNDGDIQMDVNEEMLISAWKRFFTTGTNYKDLDESMTYEKFCSMSDKDHLKKIIEMPVNYLYKSGKGFFVKKEGSVLSLCDNLKDVISMPAFKLHMKDVVEYRIMDYYKRRYQKREG